MKKLNQKGFTLIELLIVIVIIGILAGVVLQILDPARQQDRARDGVVRSHMNKIALSLGAYNAAYGTYPPGDEVLAEIENASAGASCAAGSCEFIISGVNFRYAPNASAVPITGFVLYAEARALPGGDPAMAVDEKGLYQKCTTAVNETPPSCTAWTL